MRHASTSRRRSGAAASRAARRLAAPSFLDRARRGNTLILTAGILVLLVIIASAYISRTQAGRATARAMRDAEGRTTNAHAVADALAQEIADSLFVWSVDTTAEFRWSAPPDPFFLRDNAARSSTPRIAPSPGAFRWGVDGTDALVNIDGTFGQDGISDHPYNFAPSHVVPWTNWPDNPTGAAVTRPWPNNPRDPTTGPNLFEGNPFGNPGFGDTRWLADLEPLRWDADGNGLDDSFKYWRHMSNIARPNNQWRICRDISDITDLDGDGIGGLLTNGGFVDTRQDIDPLRAPVEQWLASVQPDVNQFNAFTGDANFYWWFGDADGDGQSDFIENWQEWMLIGEFESGLFGYPRRYSDPTVIPPNLYHLKDLDADGFTLEFGERPSDEFVGPSPAWPLGTPRWNVGRVLADADGDGFTDSYWFYDPTVETPGQRRIVAVRIVDNNGMINPNVATQFDPDSSVGETPADVALLGQAAPYVEGGGVPPNWNVGFFDTLLNREYLADYPDGVGAGIPSDGSLYSPAGFPEYDVRWEYGFWQDFMSLMGVTGRADTRFDDLFFDPFERRDYWLNQGSLPLEGFIGLRPFGIPDEIELRMYHGQNYPEIFSRFERAVNVANDTFSPPRSFLRSSASKFQETTPYLDQLNNSELMHDVRRKITMYNGARNDMLPTWLQWRLRGNTRYPAGMDSWGTFQDFVRFENQARTKLDLRESLPAMPGGVIAPPSTRGGLFHLHERLPWVLLHAFADGDDEGSLNRPFTATPGSPYEGGSYMGSYAGNGSGTPTSEQDDLRKMAAAYAANILAARDDDDLAPVSNTEAMVVRPGVTRNQIGTVPLPEWGALPMEPTTQYLGLERQPFISEVFIGHVYGSQSIPIGAVPPYQQEGEQYVDAGMPQTTVVAVQLVNPFNYPLGHPLYNEPLDLSRYKLRVAGNDVELQGLLYPATEEKPTVAVFYAIEESFQGDATFRARWLDYLDVLQAPLPDLAPDSIVFNTETLVGSWSTSRGPYDIFGGDHPVELIRVDPNTLLPPTARDVVVDRIDQEFETSNQLDVLLSNLDVPPLPGEGFDTGGNRWRNGIYIGGDSTWITWARAARPWGDDRAAFDIANPFVHGVQYDQAGPRFTSAKQFAQIADQTLPGRLDGEVAPESPFRGNSFVLALAPDTPWFDRAHNSAEYQAYLTSIGSAEELRRKPTFFNQNVVYNETGVDIYPPFNDPTYGYGLYFYGTTYAPPGTPAPGWGIPDKGVYDHPERVEFAHKDGDIQAIGEIYSIFLFGHELDMVESGPGVYQYVDTERTFSEHMLEFDGTPLEDNRLHPSEVIGIADASITQADLLRRDMTNFQPPMRAGYRLYEAFVCDGSGANSNPGTNEFYNAAGFSGNVTPGLVNLNTATPEVMRALPNWNKLVYNTWTELQTPSVVAQLQRSAMPDAVVNYRERFDGNPSGFTFGWPGGADYSDRGDALELRGERGLASIGELRELTKQGAAVIDPYPIGGNEMKLERDAWTFDFQDEDGIARVSNIVTTTSDVFTVYFKIRTFTMNDAGFWDATDPEQIIDDARYVMLVDRSMVNHPTDKPRIVYMERLPN